MMRTALGELTVSFSGFVGAPASPSVLLSTWMKSLFETDDRSLAFFLSEPPASFTFLSMVFWCFLTALKSCTTPLNQT